MSFNAIYFKLTLDRYYMWWYFHQSIQYKGTKFYVPNANHRICSSSEFR